MITSEKPTITVETLVHLPVEKVWKYWTEPQHITKWNAASDDWHTPRAENDLRVGGRFTSRMEAKDGSFGFDFGGTYSQVETHRLIAYAMDDDRKVQIVFGPGEKGTRIVESFEAESENSLELQQTGWQAILNNFKKYAESQLQTIHFEIAIAASPEIVFEKMLQKPGYEQWTKVFSPSSTYEGNWEKGSKIRFLGTDDQGNTGGMLSRIRDLVPNRYVSIEHIGVVQGNNEITDGPDVDGWAGALENYTLIPNGSQTIVKIELDSNPDFLDYMNNTWPPALAELKKICEL
ncbi:MAG: SRPBCC domain-containing protein [Prolixibacteraceae bacterium]|nr:SRPBCC domain-containing protein [Prolixibacteraceae bacterium]